MKRLTIISLFLFAYLLSCSAERPDWSERARVMHPSGNLTLTARWNADNGLRLRFTPTNSINSVILNLNPNKPSIQFEPNDSYPQVIINGSQFNLDTFPTCNRESVQVTIKFRQETWSLYIDNRPIIVLPAPFHPPAIVYQSSDTLPPLLKMEPRFQKTDDFVFHDDFLVPEGDENELAAWEVQSGQWDLHSVLDDFTPAQPRRINDRPNARANAKAEARAEAKAKRKPTASMSPNFYSLRGSGTNAVLITGYDFYDSYTMEGALQIGYGEGGLVFDCTDTGAYHAFTVQPGEDSDTVRLSLWRTDHSNVTSRTELAAATTEIMNGQWVRLKVRTFQNRIQCFVDKTKVIDIPAELPVGGRFGLFADSDVPLLFDDVTARSNHDLDFPGVNDLPRHTVAENGQFFPRRGFFSLFAPRETSFLSPPRSSNPQWLIVGATSHGAHVFSAEFTPLDASCNVGLIAGYVSSNHSYLRFTCRRTAATETFRLETVSPTNATTLKELSLPRSPLTADTPETINLMCDATSGNELRCYRNKELVLVHHTPTPVGGASGLYVGPDNKVQIAHPEYNFERSDLYTDQFEKNTIFVADNFMRHWSSPEGQWNDVTNSAVWYKGDVFGRVSVHMPLVDNTAVHLGVADGATTGEWVITVTNQSLSLINGAELTTLKAPVAAIPTNRITGFVGLATNNVVGYTIHAEGLWIWLTSGKELLFEHSLPAPLQGRHIMIKGFSTAQLASSLVERYNVKDFLFKESLHEWTRNGGRWEIINRFNCDPRWSHMNGESSNTLAAIWSKYRFRGDFCVEMYAGTRHAYESTPGDFNLTVMNRDTTPSQGYTVTCSGWDYDLSRLYTKLYRNGEMMTQSDAYCAPRTREGGKRKVHLPLIGTNRDVHGAWYYIKFRRTGTKLEYYFDNELIFSANDPDPLSEGSMGVWTYMNSIMVARVKIAAESVTPRPVTFRPVAIRSILNPAGPTPATTNHPSTPLTSNNNRTSGPMDRDSWEVDDPVSQARLDWLTPTNSSPYFAVTSILGSGSLFTSCSLPPVPYPTLSGWRLDVKRTERGQFNLYYSIGRRNTNGAYTPERFYFHQLSGESFSKGKYQLTGQTAVPGSAPIHGITEWHTNGNWTTATAWLPIADWAASIRDSNVLVKIEGLGNLQAGYIVQGLTGNGPGEGYAIRNFASIPHHAAAPLPLSCAWSKQQPDTIEFRSTFGSPDRDLAGATVTIATTSAYTRFLPPNTLEASVPRVHDAATGPVSNLTVKVVLGTNTCVFTLKWADATQRTPPLLLKLDGISPLIETFESRKVCGRQPSQRTLISDFDPVQQSFLTTYNQGSAQRLNSYFESPLPFARYPVVQFRYRGASMARVSLDCGSAGPVLLSEPAGPARRVRGAGNLILDNQWHTWWGLVTDALGEKPCQPGAFNASGLRFGSVNSIDQTGLYTELGLDDLMAGPAVARNEQLAFTPHYFDFEGVTKVQMSLRNGPEDYPSLNSAQCAELNWHDIPNNQQTVPDIKPLNNGLAHIFLKASNYRDAVSPVTSIPFLIDRTPPSASSSFEPATNATGNGSFLCVKFKMDGEAPLDMEALKLKWNDTVVPITNTLGSTIIHSTNYDTLALNWPLIFRQQLNQSDSGQAFKIILSDIKDGAGNVLPDLEFPRRINYDADHTPPTVLSASYPSNIFWTTAAARIGETNPSFTSRSGGTTTLECQPGEAPYLTLASGSSTGAMTHLFSPKWNVDQYPCLAFQLRHPVLISNENPRVAIILETEATNTFKFSLSEIPADAILHAPPKPLTWASNAWQSFIIDAGKLIKNQQPAGSTNQFVVKSLTFITDGNAKRCQQQLQSVFVFASWKTNDLIKMDAYDESGIAGIQWKDTLQTNGTSLTPYSLPASVKETGWLTLRVRDKAGNLSLPLHIPILGREQ